MDTTARHNYERGTGDTDDGADATKARQGLQDGSDAARPAGEPVGDCGGMESDTEASPERVGGHSAFDRDGRDVRETRWAAAKITPLQSGQAKPLKRKGRDWEVFLYVLGYPDGPVKVGYAYDVEFRRNRLSKEEGTDLTLYHYCGVMGRYGLAAEHYAHWLLREHHYRGEWFSCDVATAAAAIDKAASVDHRGMDTIPPVARVGCNDCHIEHVSFKARIGTFKEMDEARYDDESRAVFLRTAVEAELKRRERSRPKPPKSD